MRIAVIASVSLCLVLFVFSPCHPEESSRERSETISKNQEKTGVEPPAKLEEVVVTATRLSSPVKELPVPVQVISRKEIEEYHSNDLATLLAEKLPEHFQKYPGALSSVSIRGFRTDTTGTDIKGHVLLLIDGHRSGTGNAAVIPLENVERIEIVRGPGSVVYGSAAMGGVINIITRKGKGKPSGNAGVEYGSWDYVKGRAGFSGGFFEDRLGISFAGRAITQGSYERGGGDKVENTGYNDQAYSLSLFAAPHQDHTFFAVGNFFQGWNIGTPDASYNPPNLTDNKDILRGYGSLDYDGAAPDLDLNWHLGYYGVLDRNRWNFPTSAYGYSDATTDAYTQGIRSHVAFPTFSLGRLALGFDWDRISVSSYTTPSGFGWSPDSHYDNFAFWGEEKIDWNRFTFLLGARYDLFREEILPTDGYGISGGAEQFDHVSWRVGLTYALLDWLTGRAAIGTGFRSPAADELCGRHVMGSWVKIVGNPDLEPETSTTYEAGLDAEFGGIKAGLGFFYTDYRNKISGGVPAVVDGDPSWTTYRNVDGAVLSGVEASGSYKKAFTLCDMPFSLRPFANLTWYTQRSIEDETFASILKTHTVPYVPLWDVVAGFEANFNRKVNFILSGTYVGEEKQEDFQYPSPTYGQAVDKGGFFVLSARISYRPSKSLEFYLVTENLADRDYGYVNGYPMPGRTIRAGLEARF
ncbi:MAG: TonB-dependent receptor [Desulfobacteraceae bacterium]|nr:TonB-dependent receptor [Desulfobacteraceae bacterium]